MAEYLVLIYENESTWANADQATFQTAMKEHTEFGTNNEASLRGGNALQPTGTATSIRRDGDEISVTDGPFAETKEALTGYYVVEAADLDAALAVAKQCPTFGKGGGVEVRPVMTF